MIQGKENIASTIIWSPEQLTDFQFFYQRVIYILFMFYEKNRVKKKRGSHLYVYLSYKL